jgi:nucleotide-binding universal stress UspA family protein
MDPVAGVRLGMAADQIERVLHESMVAQLDRGRRFCERAGVPCTVVIETRPPLEAILAAAADVDLVVMGSRGRGALSSSTLGSHAQRVVTGTRTPVLVVH